MEINGGSEVASGATGRPQRRTQAQRTAATRARLVAAGRKLFADHGYTEVTTEAIVAEAGVTRGALYHQFADKAALFAAVYEQAEHDLVIEITERIAAAQPHDTVAAMRLGARLFLQLCAAPNTRQIILIDAPAVLGWEQWRAVGLRYGLGILEAMLTQAITETAIPDQPIRPTAHALLGALDEAALYISRAQDPDQAQQEMDRVCDRLINALTNDQ